MISVCCESQTLVDTEIIATELYTSPQNINSETWHSLNHPTCAIAVNLDFCNPIQLLNNTVVIMSNVESSSVTMREWRWSAWIYGCLLQIPRSQTPQMRDGVPQISPWWPTHHFKYVFRGAWFQLIDIPMKCDVSRFVYSTAARRRMLIDWSMMSRSGVVIFTDGIRFLVQHFARLAGGPKLWGWHCHRWNFEETDILQQIRNSTAKPRPPFSMPKCQFHWAHHLQIRTDDIMKH
jgi:hypothetical protein